MPCAHQDSQRAAEVIVGIKILAANDTVHISLDIQIRLPSGPALQKLVLLG